MSEPACAGCLFWKASPWSVGKTGECHVGPPVAPLIRDSDGILDNDGRWPRTEDDDWCGQFVAKEETPT